MNMSALADPAPIEGPRRFWANLALAATNLIVVLDMSVANVAIPHIAGDLGITPSQGTWIITSYAVSDAITVPLTGWLAQRFGAVRTFLACMTGFLLFSVLCGVSVTLAMLVGARVGQGLCGGPLMPLTQVLLLRINPPEHRQRAMVLWAMTLASGPALGPILGGVISDNWSWHWIFLINVPAILLSLLGVFTLVRAFETPTRHVPIDGVGLALLITWVGSLQIMIDIGREHDWFGDGLVVILALIALVAFLAFLIWELTEEHPIVDLRIFRHRGFSIGVMILTLGYGSYYAGIVVIPQWMQVTLGYSATTAGYATALIAVSAFVAAQFPPRLTALGIDTRMMISCALVWIGCTTLLRANWTSDSDFWTLALPQLLAGFGMPFLFVTITTITLTAVPPSETTSAAGLQSFIRTLAIAMTTSFAMTYWYNQGRVAGSGLAGDLHAGETLGAMSDGGFSIEQTRMLIGELVEREAITIATNQIFFVAGMITLAMAVFVWMVPKVDRPSSK